MTTTTAAALAANAATAKPSAAKSFFAKLFEALIEARRMQADAYLNGYYARMSDAELARLGMTREQMIRMTRSLMAGG